MQTKTIAFTCLGVFFGVVFAVNATMITLSIKTADGLVVDHEYEKSLHYGDVIQARKRQARLGWQVRFEPPASANAPVSVQITQADGRPLTGAQARIEFQRPTSDKWDRTIALAETAPGRYAGVARLPASGLWDAVVTVKRGADSYRHVERLRTAAR